MPLRLADKLSSRRTSLVAMSTPNPPPVIVITTSIAVPLPGNVHNVQGPVTGAVTFPGNVHNVQGPVTGAVTFPSSVMTASTAIPVNISVVTTASTSLPIISDAAAPVTLDGKFFVTYGYCRCIFIWSMQKTWLLFLRPSRLLYRLSLTVSLL